MNTLHQKDHVVKRQHSEGRTYCLWIRCLMVVIGLAHLVANISFQTNIAYSGWGLVAHWALAIIAVGGAVLGPHLTVYFGREKLATGMFLGLVVLVISCGLTALFATGFYSYEERKQDTKQTSSQRATSLDDTHIATLREQISTLQRGGGGEATSARLAQLRSQRAELVQQRDAFQEKNVITAGVKPTQARIDAVDAEIAQEQAQVSSLAATSTSASHARLADLQAQLTTAIQTAKGSTLKADDVNAMSSMFENLARNWGMDPDQVRAKWFFWQPILLEMLGVIFSFLHALLLPAPVARRYQPQEPEEDSTPPYKPSIRAAAAVADANPQRPIPVKEPIPVNTVNNVPTFTDYVHTIFANWSPENPKLVGKDQAAAMLGKTSAQVTRWHQKARQSPHYQKDHANQSWARFDTADHAPTTRETAITTYLNSLP